MTVLFLDDNKNRRKHARERFRCVSFIETETVTDAIRLLDESPPFDIVHLDHDLDGKVFVRSDENSGFWVAKHISEMPIHKRPRVVVIHTHNLDGAKKMFEVLIGQVTTLIHQPYEVVQ